MDTVDRPHGDGDGDGADGGTVYVRVKYAPRFNRGVSIVSIQLSKVKSDGRTPR